MARRYRRRWYVHGSAVGLVSCDDVKAMQTSIATYRAELQASMAGLIAKGWSMPYHNEAKSSQTWADLVGACVGFEGESCLVGLFAGTQYDRGRQLITELDAWRDWLAAQKAPSGATADVPEPVPVPKSDVGLAGGLGMALAAVIVIMVLHELH
jgi:hypothetical protein